MIWGQENRVEWWFYFPKKGNSSKRGSKEMPLRYLSVTLIVTERKAYCILILSYLACFWMSQPDYLFGQQWECYCHLAFVQLWHDVSVYRTCKKYSPCSRGMEMLKRFVSFHYPLSDVSIFWGGWNVLYLDLDGGYMAVHICKNSSSYILKLCVLFKDLKKIMQGIICFIFIYILIKFQIWFEPFYKDIQNYQIIK